MLTVYQPPKEAEEADTRKLVLPAKRPYLTKVNGRLVMAREKRDKPVMDLLGEAFGLPTTRVVQRRTISASPKEELVPKFLTDASQQQIAYPPSSYASLATPSPGPTYVMPGAPWANSPSMMQVAQFQQQPPTAPPVPPQPIYYRPQLPSPSPAPVKVLEPRKATDKELKLLERINADYTKYTADQNQLNRHSPVSDHEITKETTTVVKTTATVVKHICAHCGRLRSAKFHYENPIKSGEEPVPSFCRKCQRDASSTSGSDIEKDEKPKKKKKGKQNKKGQKKGQSEKEPEEIPSEDIVEEPGKEPKKAEPVKAPSPSPKPEAKDGRLRRARSITRIKRIERTPSADYIIVEEQYSDGDEEAQQAEELRPKYLEDSELPLSQLSGRRERSTSRVESMFQSFDRPRRQEYANSESQPRRHDYTDPKPPTHPHQTSPLYDPEPLPHRHHFSSQYDLGPLPHSYHRSPSGYYEHSPAPPPSKQTNHIEINLGRRVADVQYQDEERETYQPYREHRGAYEPTKEQHSYRSHERYGAPQQQRDSRNQEYFEEHFKGECLDERVYGPSTQRRFPQKEERLEEQEFIYEPPRERHLPPRDTSSQPRSVISAAYQPQSQRRIRPKDLEVLGRSATPVIFEPPVQRHLPVRDESFEERETVSSARSQQSAQRRRRERMRPTSPSPAIKPWEAPHIIHPQANDEAVVVTERFTYKPRRLSGLREDSLRQDHDMGRESINGAKLYTRQQHPNHEANVDVFSKHYLDSWDRSGSPAPLSESRRAHFRHERRGSVPNSIRDYISADYIRRAEEYTENLPRAPTPPSIYAKESLTSHAPGFASSDNDSTVQQLAAARQRLARLTGENQVHRPRGRGYRRSISGESEAETMTRRQITRKVKEKTRGRDRERSASVIEEAEVKETRRPRQSLVDNSSERRMTHNRGRSLSNHRPPYVRETSEGGTEKEMALIPSPKTRRTGEGNPFDDDVSELAESVSSRHVKFKSPLPFSEESIREDSSSSLYESDVIEVIEEHSPPRENTSKRKEKKEMIKDSEVAYGEDPDVVGGTWDGVSGVSSDRH